MSLYNIYRPSDWDAVVGQSNIVTLLRSSLQNHRVGHAYLFTGSRGTGKTTLARIFAKAINCLDLRDGHPCGECENCRAFDAGSLLDVIEIDGASNNSVENVRDLIEKARFEPTQGKYKIYIIDEVHMLSMGAFNALLKTLEEPPEHVKFIMATTEIHKVPETIRSRVIRFDLARIRTEDIRKRLEFVCREEHIQAESQALNIIARAARGGLRDALTLLEQNTIDNTLTTAHVEATLGLLDDEIVDWIIRIMLERDKKACVMLLDSLRERNIQAQNFFDQMLLAIREAMIRSLETPEFDAIYRLYRIFRDAYPSIRLIPDSWLLIEMTIFEAFTDDANIRNQSDTAGIFAKNMIKTEPIPSPDNSLSKKSEEILTEITEKSSKKSGDPESEKNLIKTEPKNEVNFSYRILLESLKSEGVIIAALKNASFTEQDHTLTLRLSSKWHHEKLSDPKYNTILTKTLEEIFGGEWLVQVELVADPAAHLSNVFV